MLSNSTGTTSQKPNTVPSSLVSSLSTWIKKQTCNSCTEKERKLIYFGLRLNWSPCTAAWFLPAPSCSPRGSVIEISSQLIFFCSPITNLSSSTLVKAKIISMTLMTKIGKLLRWQRSEVLPSIFRPSCGKLTLLMAVLDLPSTIFINLMSLVQGWC